MNFFLRSTLPVIALLILCNNSFGAGFALFEQSVKGLGTAYAGGASTAADANAIFYNPAGLATLSGAQAKAGLNCVFPHAEYTDKGSTHVSGGSLSGGNGGDNVSVDSYIPDLYLAHRLNERFGIGVGLFSPFGLGTEYDRSWVGRYHGVDSELKTMNINPAFGIRIAENLSLGAGLNIQYIEAKLSNAIDFGTIFASIGVPGMAPQANDGFVEFSGHGWSWGYNFGLLYDLSKNARIGLAYRSQIKQTLKGEADFSGAPSQNPTGRFIDTDIEADVDLPDTVTLGLRHDLSDKLSLMADIAWTHWKTFKEMRIKFDNPAENDAVITTEWRNAFRYAAGAVYTPGKWRLRTGAAYDQTPANDPAHITPLIPDSSRIWLALGVGREFKNNLTVDMGYAHIFIKDAEIRKTPDGEDELRGGLSGSYKGGADVVGVEVSWIF